jgi:hypothetical protein
LLAFGRPPTAVELKRSSEFLRERTASEPGDAALSDLCLALFNANEFIYLD